LRRYAVARQFLALFSHAIEVSAASSDVKEMAQLLQVSQINPVSSFMISDSLRQIVYAFPVHHDISYKRRSDDKLNPKDKEEKLTFLQRKISQKTKN
jgi:hypothetical protein